MDREIGDDKVAPATQPAKARTMLSKITWRKMSTAVAPKARRVPNSRVLSLAAIQVMPSTPNPEATKVLASIQRRKNPRRPCFCCLAQKADRSFKQRIQEWPHCGAHDHSDFKEGT